MNMRTMMSFIGGAAIGAGAVYLFGPEGGRTRSILRDKTVKCMNDFQETVEKKSRHMANKMKGYRHKLDEAMEQGEPMMQRGKDVMTRAEERPTDMGMDGSSGRPYEGTVAA